MAESPNLVERIIECPCSIALKADILVCNGSIPRQSDEGTATISAFNFPNSCVIYGKS